MKPTPKKKKPKVKKVTMAKVDNLWSELVKLKAEGRCEYCGITTGLNSHHIFSRSNRSTRWYIPNGICLCVAHHVFGSFSAHKSPVEFVEWLKTARGDAWYAELRRKASTVLKPNYGTIKQELMEEEVRIRADLNASPLA